MKKIAEYLTTPQSSQDSPKETGLDDRILTRIFAVLAAQYGSRWSSLIQTEEAENVMRKVWGDSLRGIDMQTIKKALDDLPRHFPNWAPTVGQFLDLCKPSVPPLEEFKALPKPDPNPELAEKAFKQMREILRMGL